MSANDDKLLKAMEEAGLFDSGDGDSSGSDWTPIMLSDKRKKKNILYQNKKTPSCLDYEENPHFINQDDDSDRTSCGSNIEAYCTETINAVVPNPSTSRDVSFLSLFRELHNCTTNVHEGNWLQFSGNSFLVSGKYDYYHYLCDGFNDKGWGCGYRTLQTICSWMNYNGCKSLGNKIVPTIPEIQEILVNLEDKPKSFLGSRDWIGSFEVCLVLDSLYNIPFKILHVDKGHKLDSIIENLKTHFEKHGSPVMMGGDMDCSSKGIMGINVQGTEASLLIVDPHYIGPNQSNEFLYSKGFVKWQSLKDFLSSSFYNLCLPQVTAKCKLHYNT